MYSQSSHTAAVQQMMRQRRELQASDAAEPAAVAPLESADQDPYESNLTLLPLAAPLSDAVPRTPADLPYAA